MVRPCGSISIEVKKGIKMFRHESPAKERVQAWGRMAKVKVQNPTNKEANSFVTKLNAETACLEDVRRDAPIFLFTKKGCVCVAIPSAS